MLPKKHRLSLAHKKTRAGFAFAGTAGVFALKTKKNEYCYNRFAVVIPGSKVPRAVDRNVLRRMITESIRQEGELLMNGSHDVIIIVNQLIPREHVRERLVAELLPLLKKKLT